MTSFRIGSGGESTELTHRFGVVVAAVEVRMKVSRVLRVFPQQQQRFLMGKMRELGLIKTLVLSLPILPSSPLN